MPNFKTDRPRQPDYDDDQRAMLTRLLRLEQAVSAALKAATAGGATGTTGTTVISQTTVVPSGGSGGGGAAAFISLSMPPYLNVTGSPVNAALGGGFTVGDPGSGVTAGTYTAPIVTFDQYGRATFATASGITGGGAGGITALNALTAAGLTIVAGSNVTVTAAGTSITIAASAGTAAPANLSAGWWNTFPYITTPRTADTIWLNQGDATLTVLTAVEVAHQTAGLFLLAPTVASSNLSLRIRLMPKPTSAAWTATIAFQPLWRGTTFPEMGIILGNTAAVSGNRYQGFQVLQNSALQAIEVVNYTDATNFGAPTVPFTENYALRPGLYLMRVRETTGTINYEQSSDNRNWQYLTGWSTTTYLSGYNQIGYFVASRNAQFSAGMTLWSWNLTAQ